MKKGIKPLLWIVFFSAILCSGGCSLDSSATSPQESQRNFQTQIPNAIVETDGEKDAANDYIAPVDRITEIKQVSLGEVAQFLIEDVGEIDYCLNNVRVYDDFAELDLSESSIFPDDRALISAKGRLQEEYKFICLDISVTNISFPDHEQHARSLGLYSFSSDDGIGTALQQAPYFLNSEYSVDDPHYYHFDLEIGQSTDITLGWIIDLHETDLCNLYLCVGAGFVPDDIHADPRKFIKLEWEE